MNVGNNPHKGKQEELLSKEERNKKFQACKFRFIRI